MSTAYAHSLEQSLYEPLPEGLFSYKMDFDPTLIAFVIMAALYYRGLKAFRGKAPIATWQKVCFCLGISFNILALSPPIDPLSDRLFFVHMIQHIIITDIGTPLMLLGVPFFIISRGLSPTFRRRIYLPLIKNEWFRKAYKLLLHPLIALGLFEANYWFWHIPRFYNWALLNDFVHLLEHGLMAFFSFCLWRNIIDAYPLRCRLPLGFRILYLAAIMALNTILAAGLTYAETIWYAYEGIPMPPWWAAHWSHLDDQRLGGLIMWVPGGLLSLIAMTTCFFVWAYREAAKDKPRQRLQLSRGWY
jgi:cytochrome c oxidase assembly factor CtaG